MKKIINLLNKSKYFPCYIITPIPYGIGTAAIDILFGINKSRISNKKLLIIVPRLFQKYLNYSICNKYLFDKLIIDGYSQFKHKYIRNLFYFLITISFVLRRTLALFLKKYFNIVLKEDYFFSFLGITESYYDTDSEIKENFNNINEIKDYDFFTKKNTVHLDEKTDFICKEILKKKGLEENQDFVCLHVREGAFKKDYNRRPYRNSNIDNYYKLIEYLCEKNIFVIRLGQISDSPLKIKKKNILDLPFSDIKHDFFDLYIVKNCKFYIGDQSGMTDLAMLFNKDCLKTNMLRVFELGPATTKSRTICKIPYFKKNNKKLNLKEYLNLPYLYHHAEFINEELDFVENSSEELYAAIKEYYDLIYNHNKVNLSLNQKQLEFNKLLLDRLSQMYFKKDKDLDSFYRKYWLLRWVKSNKGSYCSTFLDKYF